jgi:hypothetical protein
MAPYLTAANPFVCATGSLHQPGCIAVFDRPLAVFGPLPHISESGALPVMNRE